MGGSRIKQLGAKVQQILTALPEMRSAFAESVAQGSVHRLRPKLMTVAAVLASLIPILSESGVGSDVMKPIAAPLPVPIPIRASRRLRIRLVQKFRNFPLATSRLLQTRCYSRTKARRPMPRSSLPPFRPGPKIKENLSSPNTKTPLMRRMPGSPKTLTPQSRIRNEKFRRRLAHTMLHPTTLHERGHPSPISERRESVKPRQLNVVVWRWNCD